MAEMTGAVPSREQMRRAARDRHGDDLQDRLERTTAAICGLGGLGSNAAVCLARAGIGRLILIDFDRVDVTNLHRQQYKAAQVGMYKTQALSENLAEIAPYVETETRTELIGSGNFRDLLDGADIIIEAFDDPQAKAMLVNGVLENLPDRYLIAASGMAGTGSSNTIRTRKITERFYLCGDGISDVADDIGLVSSRVMICAAHQAHMAIRLIAGETEAW